MCLPPPLEGPEEYRTTQNLKREQEPVISKGFHAEETEHAAYSRKSQTHYSTRDGSDRSDHCAEPFRATGIKKLIDPYHHALSRLAHTHRAGKTSESKPRGLWEREAEGSVACAEAQTESHT